MFALIANGMFYARTLVDGLRGHLGDERGQDLIEYAMLGGLIAAALAVGALVLTGALSGMATGIGNCIDFDATSPCG